MNTRDMRSRHSAGRGLAVVFMAFATGCKSNKIFRIIRAFPPVFHGAADFSHVYRLFIFLMNVRKEPTQAVY